MLQNSEILINDFIGMESWIESFKDSVLSAVSSGLKVVVIAIARKMSRLLDFYKKTNATLDNLFDEYRDYISVITEHAIPFELYGATAIDTEVIILDDLIVFGDTVETVTDNVYFLTGIKPKIIAIAASDRARLKSRRATYLYPDLEKNSEVILPNDRIAAFTAQQSYNILSLRRSIDLEHTILNKTFIKGIGGSGKDYVEKLKKLFIDSSVYEISHTLPNYAKEKAISISICSPEGSIDRLSNDFSKHRVYFQDCAITITSISPNIWKEGLLHDTQVEFDNPIFNSIWKKVCNRLNALVSSPLKDQDELTMKVLSSDYAMRVEHSAVVMANYLMSYSSVLHVKSKFESVFQEMGSADFTLCGDDVQLLVGKTFAKELLPILLDAMQAENTQHRQFSETITTEKRNQPLIPTDRFESYQTGVFRDVYLSYSLHSALSLIFNRLWRDFGMINCDRREDRIPVGESFDSLRKALSLFYPADNLMEEINKWIDINIDLGVVVPKYEYFYDNLGRRIWRRFFRTGERESLMIDVARAALTLLYDSFRESNKLFISFEEFNALLQIPLKQLNEISNGQVEIDLFKKGILRVDKVDNPMFLLWIFMVQLGVLELESPSDWRYAKVVLDSQGNPVYESTAIFKI